MTPDDFAPVASSSTSASAVATEDTAKTKRHSKKSRKRDDAHLMSSLAQADRADGRFGAAAPSGSRRPISSGDIPPLAFAFDQVEETDQFKKLEHDETFIAGLERLDPRLLSKHKGKSGLFTRYTVLEGQVGLGTKYGRTRFYPPGNYFWLGFGREINDIVDVQVRGEDRPIRHGDVEFINITPEQAAVIQLGSTQHVVEGGRYLMRMPAKLEGVVNLCNLKNKETREVITEEPKVHTDKKTGVKLVVCEQHHVQVPAGQWEEVGAVKFVRPEPGYRYVIERSDGSYEIGRSLAIARDLDRFVGWLDYQEHSRTTQPIKVPDKDLHSVRLLVQLSWQLVNGKTWLEKTGGGKSYTDPFDYLEEKTGALFRDKIGACSYDELISQQSDGYESIEKEIRPVLEEMAAALGTQLIDMQVRELSFPELDGHRVALAQIEAEKKQETAARQRNLEIQKLKDKERLLQETAQQERDRQAAEHQNKQDAIQHKSEMQKVQAQIARQQAQVDGEALREKARLEAVREQEAIKAETARVMALGEAEAEAARIERMAKAELEAAKLRAQATLEVKEAEATGIKKLGEALADHPDAKEIELVRLANVIDEKRSEVLAQFADNPQAILPPELQQEALRMRAGFPPQVPAISAYPISGASK